MKCPEEANLERQKADSRLPGLGEGERVLMHTWFPTEVLEVFGNWIMGMGAQLCEYTTTQ